MKPSASRRFRLTWKSNKSYQVNRKILNLISLKKIPNTTEGLEWYRSVETANNLSSRSARSSCDETFLFTSRMKILGRGPFCMLNSAPRIGEARLMPRDTARQTIVSLDLSSNDERSVCTWCARCQRLFSRSPLSPRRSPSEFIQVVRVTRNMCSRGGNTCLSVGAYRPAVRHGNVSVRMRTHGPVGSVLVHTYEEIRDRTSSAAAELCM